MADYWSTTTNSGYKACTSCKRTLPNTTEHFSSNGKDRTGLRSHCKPCRHKGIRKALCKKYRTDDYNKAQRCDKYGLTIEELEALLEETNCAICQCLLDHKGGKASIDHNHTTGEVRGMLCANCNRALGGFQDNTSILRSAIRYLEDRGSYLDIPDDMYPDLDDLDFTP